MSRRYRLEEEKALQLTQDLIEEEDKLKLQMKKIFGPIIWRRISEGIRIQDLQEDHFEETLDLIEKYYITEDLLFRNTDILNDLDSIKSFREKLLFTMKDRCSIIAVEESTEKVVGVLLLKAMKKSDYGCVFSRTQVGEGKCYQSILIFLNRVNKSIDIFEHFNCEIYLRFYLICVKSEYRSKSIGFQLMDTGVIIANHLGIKVIMGIFDCYKLQRLARKLGMELLYEQEYTSWVDNTGELKFCDPGAGNYSCALMAGQLLTEPEVIEEPTKLRLSEEIEEKDSATKIPTGEKRKTEKNRKISNIQT